MAKSQLQVVKTLPSQWHDSILGTIDNVKQRVADNPNPVGFACVLVWSDGTIASTFDGDDYARILGAISYLQRRITDEYE